MLKIAGKTIYEIIDMCIEFRERLVEVRANEPRLSKQRFAHIYTCAYVTEWNNLQEKPSAGGILKYATQLSIDSIDDVASFKPVQKVLEDLTNKHGCEFLCEDENSSHVSYSSSFEAFEEPIEVNFYNNAIAVKVHPDLKFDISSTEFIEFCMKRGININVNNYMEGE